MNEQVDFLVKLRDACMLMADAANEYIESIAPPEVKDQAVAVQEVTFTSLKFEKQRGTKLGEYEIANKQSNPSDKWQNAYNILQTSNATIKNRYHSEEYLRSYWLYDQDKIYRQKLKQKA
jgi:hypothetical protein